MRFTMVLAIGVLGCGKVNDGGPLAGDAAAPAPDAAPPAPDAMVDSAMPAPVVDALPETCGNGTLDLGEDCDGSEGCPATCHVAPPAGSVALRFSGTVTLVDDRASVFSGRVVIGTAIWGRLVYPTNLTATDASVTLGQYPYNDLDTPDAIGLWMTVADWQFSPARGSGTINVGNGLGADPDGFFAQLGNGISTPQVAALQGMSLNLADPSRTALAQVSLPRTSFPGVAAWATRTASLYGDNSTDVHWYVQTSIDHLMLEVP
jgi:hypothetical protein